MYIIKANIFNIVMIRKKRFQKKEREDSCNLIVKRILASIIFVRKKLISKENQKKNINSVYTGKIVA